MKMKIYWTEKEDYPVFYREEDLKDGKNVFHLNEKTLKLMRDKRCFYYAVSEDNIGLEQPAKAVMNYVKGKTNDIEMLVDYFC